MEITIGTHQSLNGNCPDIGQRISLGDFYEKKGFYYITCPGCLTPDVIVRTAQQLDPKTYDKVFLRKR